MGTGAITQYVDLAQLILYVFLLQQNAQKLMIDLQLDR